MMLGCNRRKCGQCNRVYFSLRPKPRVRVRANHSEPRVLIVSDLETRGVSADTVPVQASRSEWRTNTASILIAWEPWRRRTSAPAADPLSTARSELASREGVSLNGAASRKSAFQAGWRFYAAYIRPSLGGVTVRRLLLAVRPSRPSCLQQASRYPSQWQSRWISYLSPSEQLQ